MYNTHCISSLYIRLHPHSRACLFLCRHLHPPISRSLPLFSQRSTKCRSQITSFGGLPTNQPPRCFQGIILWLWHAHRQHWQRYNVARISKTYFFYPQKFVTGFYIFITKIIFLVLIRHLNFHCLFLLYLSAPFELYNDKLKLPASKRDPLFFPI